MNAEYEQSNTESLEEMPDYWPDVRRIPDAQLPNLANVVREVRDNLGLSNAALGREVRELVERHNAVAGREKVVSFAAWAEKGDGERCNQELQSVGKGTRKYAVGYLAWLRERDETAARKFYADCGMPFGSGDAAHKEQFYIYEAAFLWLGHEVPSMADHQNAMSAGTAKMKAILHTAAGLALIDTTHVSFPTGGQAWTVTRSELKRFAEASGSRPEFLYPGEEPSSENAAGSLARAEGYLAREIERYLIPVEDWAAEYERNEWMVYEAAFLWHGLMPPEASKHHYVMPDTVRQTKQMLHDAANAGTLTPSVDIGYRQRNVLNHGTRFVTRPELRQFAASIDQKPRFLFPSD